MTLDAKQLARIYAKRTPPRKTSDGHVRHVYATPYDLVCALDSHGSPAAFAATRPKELRDALGSALLERDDLRAQLRWTEAELTLLAISLHAERCCLSDCPHVKRNHETLLWMARQLAEDHVL